MKNILTSILFNIRYIMSDKEILISLSIIRILTRDFEERS